MAKLFKLDPSKGQVHTVGDLSYNDALKTQQEERQQKQRAQGFPVTEFYKETKTDLPHVGMTVEALIHALDVVIVTHCVTAIGTDPLVTEIIEELIQYHKDHEGLRRTQMLQSLIEKSRR